MVNSLAHEWYGRTIGGLISIKLPAPRLLAECIPSFHEILLKSTIRMAERDSPLFKPPQSLGNIRRFLNRVEGSLLVKSFTGHNNRRKTGILPDVR